MKVITVRSQIRELPNALEKAWKGFDGWRRIVQPEPDTEKIYAAVVALDPETATIDDVTKAMRFSSSWVEVPLCHECGRRINAVVSLGEEPDYESHIANVCVECLQKAIEMVTTAVPNAKEQHNA